MLSKNSRKKAPPQEISSAKAHFLFNIDCIDCFLSVFMPILQNTGTEQHRHHAVEISLYNMYSFLWEIETGAVYSMTKANDIYSGLGQQDKLLTPTTKAAESDASEATADAAGAENMATIAEGENETETENESEGKDLADLLAEECEQANSEDAAAQAAASGIKDADLPPPPPSSTLRTSGITLRMYRVVLCICNIYVRQRVSCACYSCFQSPLTCVLSVEKPRDLCRWCARSDQRGSSAQRSGSPTSSAGESEEARGGAGQGHPARSDHRRELRRRQGEHSTRLAAPRR